LKDALYNVLIAQVVCRNVDKNKLIFWRQLLQQKICFMPYGIDDSMQVEK